MKIEQLGKGKFEKLIGTVSHLDEVEKVEIDGGETTRQNGILQDDTGQIRFTFWDEKFAGKFKVGDKLMINAFCKEFKEDLQITTGKFGKVTLIPDIDPVM